MAARNRNTRNAPAAPVAAAPVADTFLDFLTRGDKAAQEARYLGEAQEFSAWMTANGVPCVPADVSMNTSRNLPPGKFAHHFKLWKAERRPPAPSFES